MLAYQVSGGLINSRTGYALKYGLALNGVDEFLSFIPDVAGDLQNWAWSGWVCLLDENAGVNSLFTASWSSLTGITYNNNKQQIYWGTTSGGVFSSAEFSDFGNWQHVCMVADGVDLNVYTNGTLTASKPISGNGAINDAVEHFIGADGDSPKNVLQCLVAGCHFVGLPNVDWTDFAELNNGNPEPKKYNGGYGSNGSCLTFEDKDDLGKDFSLRGKGYSRDLIPTMISDSAPSGTITYSSQYNATNAAWKAFNDDKANGWIANGVTGWLAYEFTEAKTLVGYTLYSGTSDVNRMPKNWTFEGWTGSAWEIVDTVTNETGWANGETRLYDVGSPAAYTKYRINISENNGNGSYCHIHEMQMFERGDGKNHWATHNIDASNQVMSTPTNVYPTLNQNDKHSSITLSNANLTASATSSWINGRVTLGLPKAGKWSFQVTMSQSNSYGAFGLCDGANEGWGDLMVNGVESLYYYNGSGALQTKRTGSVVSETTNDPPKIPNNTSYEIIIDMDNRQLGIRYNDVTYMAIDVGLEITDKMDTIFYELYSGSATFDFGQNGYVPTDPTCKTLAVKNLPKFTQGDVSNFHCQGTYQGTGAIKTNTFKTNLDGLIDFGNKHYKLRIKSTTLASSHRVFDTMRGAGKYLETDSTKQETEDLASVTAMNGTGFDLGAEVSGGTNRDGHSFIYDVEVAGDTIETGTFNGTLSVTRSVGKNLSIIEFTGNSDDLATIDTGLPSVAWAELKCLDVNSYNNNWFITNKYLEVGEYFTYTSAGVNNVSNTSNGAGWEPNSTSGVITVQKGTVNADTPNQNGKRYILYAYSDEPDTHHKVFTGKGNANADGAYYPLGGYPVWSHTKSEASGNHMVFLDALEKDNPRGDYIALNEAWAKGTTANSWGKYGLGMKALNNNSNTNPSNKIYGRAWLKNRVGPTTQPRGR